jgi:osmotically-inducible protein OsmY
MNVTKALKPACAALIVLASVNAWAQATGAGASSGTPATVASGGAASMPSKQANRALRKSVYAALGKDKAIDAGSISVTAKDGAVTLAGTVAEATQIEKAAALAKGVPGVVSVKNKLTVQRGFGQ